MILIPIIETFDGILGEMTGLVNKLRENSPQLQAECAEFVERLESASEKYRFPITGQLAVIRGKILCGAPEPGNENLGRKERKAAANRFLMGELEKACNCVANHLAEERRVIAECERLACQVTARLAMEHGQSTLSGTEISGSELIRLAAADPELSPILAHITGLAGAPNTAILFDKIMSSAGIYN